MMTDLFSSFDPLLTNTTSTTQSLNTQLAWFTNLIPMMIITSSLWLTPTRLSAILTAPLTLMNDQMNRTTGKSIKGMSSIITPLFTFLILTNWSGLIPYLLPTSSHLMFTLAFGLPLWLTMIISSITKNTKAFVAALLPEGAPDWLNPFLTLAETISISVRPATLSFRLAANMSAGHIVLGLIGTYAVAQLLTANISTFLFVMPAHIGYITFELGMGMIQAFIFCLLLTLYSNEHSV